MLPTLTVFEKTGTFVNQQFRLQKFAKAVPGPAGVTDDLVVLAKLVAVAAGGVTLESTRSGQPSPPKSPRSARSPSRICPRPACCSTPRRGPALPFVEGETLHYKPAAAADPGLDQTRPDFLLAGGLICSICRDSLGARRP